MTKGRISNELGLCRHPPAQRGVPIGPASEEQPPAGRGGVRARVVRVGVVNSPTGRPSRLNPHSLHGLCLILMLSHVACTTLWATIVIDSYLPIQVQLSFPTLACLSFKHPGYETLEKLAVDAASRRPSGVGLGETDVASRVTKGPPSLSRSTCKAPLYRTLVLACLLVSNTMSPVIPLARVSLTKPFRRVRNVLPT